MSFASLPLLCLDGVLTMALPFFVLSPSKGSAICQTLHLEFASHALPSERLQLHDPQFPERKVSHGV